MTHTKVRSKVTIDELARMVNNGFKEQTKNLEDFKVEMREFKKEVRDEFAEFRQEVRNEFDEFRKEVRGEFKEVKHSLKGHRHELDEHEGRIHKVEKDLEIA